MEKLVLPSQRKIIFEAIVRIGLEPSNFEWDKKMSRFDRDVIVSCLRYKGTDFFFKFDFYKNDHHCRYSPGIDRVIVDDFPGDWQQQWQCLMKWMSSLKREIEVVDPWDEIEQYIPGEKIDLEDGEANKSFSYSQVEHITQSLNKLKEEINKNFKLNESQTLFLNNKLDYLIDRAKNIGRIDWRNIFVSTIIMIAFELAMNPEQVKLLWSLVKVCFRGVLLLGGKS